MKLIFLPPILMTAIALEAATAPVEWSDVFVPVEGRRYVYRGVANFAGLLSAEFELRIEYSNVQSTSTGIRYDRRETTVQLSNGFVGNDWTETRELIGNNEVILRRVDHGPNPYFRSENLRDVTYTQGNVAPRTFEIGVRFNYEHRIVGLATVVESRTVGAAGFENTTVTAGAFRTLRIDSSGLVLGERSYYGVWVAKNVGPVRIVRPMGLYTGDFGLVSTNFPIVPGVFDEPGPKIVAEPESLAVVQGSTARFRIQIEGEVAAVEWMKDGVPIAGATSTTLVLSSVTTANVGKYQSRVSGAGRSVLSREASLMVTSPGKASGKLVNLSVLSFAGKEDAQLIAGIVLQGATAPHRVLVRAAGPWLQKFSVPGYCTDPVLSVRNASGTIIALNDDWGQFFDQTGVGSVTPAVGAFPFDSGSKDSALIAVLGSGNFSVLASDQAGGMALVECYDVDSGLTGGFSNLSVRTEVKSQPLIVGLVVSGTEPVRLLFRAVGPSLGKFGVLGVHPNPRLRIIGSHGEEVARNEDWSTSAQGEEVRGASLAVGAFSLDENSTDAALVAMLPPGAYSAVVETPFLGGNTLVEVYRLPE